MPQSTVSRALGCLRRTALVQRATDYSDGQLLEWYVRRRDEAAFEALVHRHGPMVLGVCRRVLGNADDADDAFQATFLILVRKAHSVRPRDAVGNWLYGVAYRAALKTKALAVRRKAREKQVSDMPEPITVDEGLWNDLEAVLDRELNLLPDRYRQVVVLCDLEGKTRREAARQLGCPEGTVAGRLARGRALLARRLTRLGVPVSAGMLAAALAANGASAAVPLSRVRWVAHAVSQWSGGINPIPGRVAAITEGVVKTMLATKLKMGLAVLVTVGLLGTAGFRSLPAFAADQPGSPGETGQKKDASGAKPATLTVGNLAVEEVDPDQRTLTAGTAWHFARLTHRSNDQELAKFNKVEAIKEGQLQGVRMEIARTAESEKVQFVKVVQPKEPKLTNLPVAPTARIRIGKKVAQLGDLKPGMPVTLEVGILDGRMTIVGIMAEALEESPKEDGPTFGIRSFQLERTLRDSFHLEARPATISVEPLHLDGKHVNKVVVRADKPFRILRVDGKETNLDVKFDNKEAKTSHVLIVTFKSRDPISLDKVLRIITDLNEGREVDIQIRGKIDAHPGNESCR